MSRRMKKNRRVLSFALAFVMLVSLLPLSAVFSALAAGDEDADISVVMTADKETCGLDETAKVTINAEIAETIQSAEVTIHFDAEEVTAIQAPDNGWAPAVLSKDGSTLTFTLSANADTYTKTFSVKAPSDAESFEFEITADETYQVQGHSDIVVSEIVPAKLPSDDEEKDSLDQEQTPDVEGPTNENDPSQEEESIQGNEPTDVEGNTDKNESSQEDEPTNEDAAPQVKGVSYLVNDPDTSESSEDPFVPKVHLQGVTIVFEDQPEIPEEPAEDLDFYVSSLSTSVDQETGIAPIDRKLTDFTVAVETKVDKVPEAGGSYTFYLQITLPEEMNLESVPDGLVSLADLEASGATLGEIICEGNTLTIPVTQTVEAQDVSEPPVEDDTGDTSTGGDTEPEPQTWAYTFNINASDLPPLSDTFAGGEIKIDVVDAENQTVTGAFAQTIEVKPVSVETKFTVTAEENLTQTISWVDNNNDGNTRPSDFPRPDLYFQVDGNGTWTKLTWDDLSGLGLKQMPELKVTTSKGGIGTLIYKDLPTEIQIIDESTEIPAVTHNIQWSFSPDGGITPATPPEVDGYQAEVIEDGKTWYYVQLTDFEFDVHLLWGTLGQHEGINGVTNAVLEHFAVYSGDERLGSLAELYQNGPLTYIPSGPDKDNPNHASVTVAGVPKYNTDGSLIDYTVDLADNPNSTAPADMQLSFPDVLEDDYLQARFDNSSQANHTKDDPELLAGGTLYLTLTGTTGFTATKEWKDEATSDKRPTVTFQLYRYREGSDFHSASPVPDPDTNSFITVEPEAQIAPETGTESTDTYILSVPEGLPKYDPDGYRYVYFLKESMTYDSGDQNYEQVFGRVDAYGSVVEGTDRYPGDSRADGDTGIYNEGVVTNRPSDYATVRLSKVWEASAFQGMLEDVEVEFTLQWRTADSNNDWTNVQNTNGERVTATQTGITEENMNFDASATVSAYGPDGQLMEFRWVESGVYQGKDSTNNLLTGEPGGEQTFTLEHNGQSVTYVSEAEYADTDKNSGDTTITNSISATLDYTAIKQWTNTGKLPTKEVTFDLYRYYSGAELSSQDKPYLSFKWDGTEITIEPNSGIDISYDDNKAANVTIEGTKTTWETIIHDLPRYDKHGREYEYLLLERVPKGESYFPVYETKRDPDGNYTTTVFNGPGEGPLILVRKEWTDDSDSAHRGDVTVKVYTADGDELILTGDSINEDNEAVLKDGVWTVEVGLVGVTQEYLENGNIYILETHVGDTQVPLSHFVYGNDGDTSPDYETPSKPIYVDEDNYSVYQYETDHHRYEATYSKINLSGQDIFVVNNRRLGTVDLTAAKVWQDGTGTLREALNEAFKELGITAYLELSFAEGSEAEDHEIWTARENEGYVTLGSTNTPIMDDKGTKHVSHRQEITMDGSENQQTFHFFNLPKYDMTGAVVHYEVNEVWYDSDDKLIASTADPDFKAKLTAALGNECTGDLETLMGQFSVSVTGDYKADPDDGTTDGIQNDEQTVTVTNRLGDTKTVSWTKHWKDDYTFNQSQRPDIYLDIYRVTYDEDENGTKTVRSAQLYRHDYLWTPDSKHEYGDDGDTANFVADPNNWTVTMSNVDQYDSEGYEYFYYAVERTRVNAGEYDYDYAQYSHAIDDVPWGPQDLGDRNELTSEEVKMWTRNGAPVILDMKASETVKEEIEESDVDSYPNYALLEGGEITNSISDTVTIEGRKLWQNTPGGFSDEHLPTVTFALDQYVQGADPETAKEVATLTVSEWADKNVDGTYSFTFEYLEDNNNVNPDAVVNPPTRLPRYDESGKLYIYELREKTIEYADDIGKTELFKFNYDNNTYLIENAYNSPKGELYVRKHLALPTVLDASADGGSTTFPSIQFVLTRSYSVKGANGAVTTVEDKQFKETETWSWQDVKAAYQEARENSQGDDLVWLNEVLTFKGTDGTGLELYAPNGSKYVYTVTEKRDDFLYGYKTTAEIGDYSKDAPLKGMILSQDGEPQVTGLYPSDGEKKPSGTTESTNWATFKNVPVQSTIQITGTKVWSDFDNAFNLRPDWNNGSPTGITLTLSRTAASQPGQNNSITETMADGTYTVAWTKDESKPNEWTYTITGPEGSEGLDAIAPNGMPWTYRVTETLDEDLKQIYSATPSNGQVSKDADDAVEGTLTMDDLKNSTEASVPYSKVWMDKDGNTITEDYLGKDVSVTFQVQVRPMGYNEWTNADEYFKEVLDDEAYNQFFSGDSDKFVRTVNGRLGGSGWSGSFTGLPKAILRTSVTDDTGTPDETVDTSKFLFLEYRVVETSVNGQKVTVKDDGGNVTYEVKSDNDDLVDSATFATEGNVTTNKLKLQSLTIKKVWDDGNNQYGTRPTPGSALQWLVSFVVQQKDGEDWVTVKDPANQSQDLVITLSSNNNDNEQSTTISGLPLGEYRVRELQPDWKRDNGTVSSDYFVDEPVEGSSDTYYFYNKTYTTKYEGSNGAYTVTNTLEVIPDEGNITVTKTWHAPDETAIPDSITVTLQRKTKDAETWEDYLGPVVLNKDNDWTHIWTGLPNFTNEGEELEYQVVENNPGAGYILLNPVTAGSGNSWHFINVSTTSLSVTKTWDSSIPEETRPESITVQLWQVGADGVAKLVTNRELKLPAADGSWTGTFDNLPAYDEDGHPYTYYAREVDTGNFAAVYQDAVVDGVGGAAATFLTSIYNTGKTEVSGAKTWVGTGDRNGIELNLWRRTAETEGTEVPEDEYTLTWTNRDDQHDTWTYTFSDLPATDANGAAYTYWVTESPMDGYDVKVEGNHFTNVAEGSLTVSKVLSGGGAESGRDFHFTVTLTGVSTSGTKAEDFNETLGNVTFVNGVGSFTLRGGQSITIEGLPAGLDYTVEETDANQNGYTTSDNGNTQGEIPAGGSVYVQFTNYKPGSGGGGGDDDTDVDVEKRWVSHGSGTKSGSVTVQLLRNGQPYDTVELSEDNGWSYDWDSLDPQYDWSVREVNVTRGFSDHTSRTGGSYTITNEDAPPTEDIPDDPTPSTDIPDDPTPSTDVPEDPDVPDEPDEPGTPDQPDKPETPDSPKTDDPTRSELWALLCLASLAGMALLGASMAWSRHGKRGGKRLK